MSDRATGWRRCFWAWMSATATLVAGGCGGANGPERATVSGEVTLDGEPVDVGLIAFIPDGTTQGPTTGAAIEKGKYAIPTGVGPILGTHRVEITAHRSGKKDDAAGGGSGGVGPSGAATAVKTEMYIPAQYNKNSTLSIAIKSGKNVQDFPLKSTP